MFQDMITELVREGRNKGVRVQQMTDAVQKQYVIEVLIAHNFKQSRAARELGWHRNTLGRKLDELDINVRALQAEHLGRKPAASHGAQQNQIRFA